MTCDICGSFLEFLGMLGRLAHFKCRGCGMLWSKKDYEVEFEEKACD